MKFHRPKSWVSKNEATRKLFNAIRRGNTNSAQRQLNRGANITAKQKNHYNRNRNLYDVINDTFTHYDNANTHEYLMKFIANKGYNMKKRENQKIEEAAKHQENMFKMVEESRKRNKMYIAKIEKERLNKLKSEYHREQEKLRTLVNARKRLAEENAAVIYNHGKPQGLSIKIPKTKTRKNNRN